MSRRRGFESDHLNSVYIYIYILVTHLILPSSSVITKNNFGYMIHLVG